MFSFAAPADGVPCQPYSLCRQLFSLMENHRAAKNEESERLYGQGIHHRAHSLAPMLSPTQRY